MTSVVATDNSGPVEYYFSCVEGGTGCVDSGWQQDNVYSLSGLAPDTYYAFTVQARDALGNANQPSAAMGATTDPEPDTLPPQPGTMSWQSAPSATGTSSVTMTSIVATDQSGPVEYYFTCVEGGAGCVDSGWQRSNVYSLNGLAPDTYYAFRVQARDALGNANQPSATMGATTDPEAVTPPQAANEDPVAVITYSPDPAVITKGKNVEVVLSGADSYDPDGSIASWTWKSSSGEVLGSGETYKVRLKEGTHSFTLEVVDNMGASAISSASVVVGTGTSDDGGVDEPKPKKPPPGKNKG
jgi:chitodextrinase